MFELIKKLAGIYGVSGNEEEIREAIKNEIQGCVNSVETDALGNLTAIKKGGGSGSGKKIMVAAHMDEIGVMATYIDDKGFIRFSNVGWVSPYYALAQKVRFKNGTIGAVFYEEKLEEMKNLKYSNMYIDIGTRTREETGKRIKIGDAACFVNEAVLQDDMIISKALDDRTGCAVLIKTIKNMPDTDNEIYFVFTVQEELGLRGAKTSAYNIKPDMAIAVDVTDTGDTPESPLMEVRCGEGPTIKLKDKTLVCHPEVRKLLEVSAKKAGVQWQYEILEKGGSDSGAIHLAVGGIPSGGISIPCRYVHSPVETASIGDLEGAVRLLTQAIKA